MFDRIRTRLLFWLRVPEDPAPPAGARGSARVFRAGRKFYQLRLGRWGLAQLGAIAGIAFSLVMLERMEAYSNQVRAAATKRPAATAAPTRTAPAAATPPSPEAAAAAPEAAPAANPPSDPPAVPPAAIAAPTSETVPPAKSKRERSRNASRLQSLDRIAEHWPVWVFPLLRFAEFCGVVLYLAQIPITYAMVRLEYELRWYIVTDRSLRIRSGLTTVQESTMSFANIQQVVVSQGPLQRVLGIADLRVQSAGGGGDEHEKSGGDSLHTGVFHGVDNANEIRDLILERLRQFREAGLGDPEDRSPAPEPPTLTPAALPDALAAAQEVLAATRDLRRALE
jgi:hypothetical protein